MCRWTPLALLLAAACSDPIEPPHQLLPQTADANFTLHVSNQSFAIDPVDILVTLDGEPAMRGDFEVGSQHSWHDFHFQLAPGPHTLVATSGRGAARLERTFTVESLLYGALAYWYYPQTTGGAGPTPRHLDLLVSTEPIYFD